MSLIPPITRPRLVFSAPTDARRWITLAILSAAAVIVAIDTTVLNVAIPTMMREFDTQLPTLQWVIAAYSLTFASCLIVGGRLGDLLGHRRTFVIGAALFGTGSLIAALSTSVPMLVVGEGIIEGVGAALMMPAAVAMISTSFQGHERAVAFGVFGAAGGVGGVLGPVVGGLLVTNASWRASFGINVVVATLAVVGALVCMPARTRRRGGRLDLTGSMLAASGMALLVFGLSQGQRYGWLVPAEAFRVAGRVLWPDSAPVSLVAVALVVAGAVLTAFTMLERAKERRGHDPLFGVSQLRRPGFRYGLITTVLMAVGSVTLGSVMPVFLQSAQRLSAQTNGLWMLPAGCSALMGARLAVRLSRRLDVTRVVLLGLASVASSLAYVAVVLSTELTFWTLVPGTVLFGLGIGLSLSQLTNLVLSNVDPDRAGVAGGASSTARQLGLALGIAVVGPLFHSRTVSGLVDRLRSAPLPAGVRTAAIESAQVNGVRFVAPGDVTTSQLGMLRRLHSDALTSGARLPLLVAAAVVGVALLVALRVPRLRPVPAADLEGVAGPGTDETDEPVALSA